MRLALYGMPTLEREAHDACSIAEFCRNPLHPGPCKGWRRTAGVLDADKPKIEKPKVEKPPAVKTPAPKKTAAARDWRAPAPEPAKKTGPRDGDGDGKLNEGGYEKKGRAPAAEQPAPAPKARARAIAAGQRATLDAAADASAGSFLTSASKRDVNALVKKGWLERKGNAYHLTDDGRAAHEADKSRGTKVPPTPPAKTSTPPVKEPVKQPVAKPATPPAGTKSQAKEPGGDFAHRAAGTDLFAADQGKLAGDVVKDRDSRVAADRGLAVIGAQQGFDGKPRVVSKAELDALLKDGHPEVYRGVTDARDVNMKTVRTAEQIQEDMRTGDAYYGTGIYGNGYYWGSPELAAQYAGESSKNATARAALDKDAKVVDAWKDLLPEHEKFMASLKGHPDEERMRDVYGDMGRYAAARGYDAIIIDPNSLNDRLGKPHTNEKPWYNVLNRTAMVVEEAGKK